MARSRRKYSPEFRFQVIMKVLQSDKPLAEIARAYDVQRVTVSKWKQHFEGHGAEVFGGKKEVKMYGKKLGDLERMLGKKEVEIAQSMSQKACTADNAGCEGVFGAIKNELF